MILCIETATKNCSVALVSKGVCIAHRSQFSDKYIHGERLHGFIKELMVEANLSFQELSGVCVGKGPGSYTGLRIGVSAAKGICFAARKKLYSMPTLGCFDFNAIQKDFVLAVIDARRDEVYALKWKREGGSFACVGKEHAEVVDLNSWTDWKEKEVHVIGDAAQKVAGLHKNPIWSYSQNSFPDAAFMNQYIRNGGMNEEDVAYFEPFYLKDFVAVKSKKNLL
ncbi:MAG: tRNA (adenosine(37)-N6)-threonylcarbamoyltransferase complex dimerization subunit type 1 TsaB [Flavobacteriales bacterium]|nr:tRNA (adenosine(37)-N6)-threonylcarbamoyltransferase complex dimerization subunit type 1 TsaB [Flavobacteriales bacterium]|tara:strand:- start:2790 stop:3461 length:672 start_codon:yes stop_codon:yes gene_type:complete